MRKNSGFTLIELLVVISIIGMLSSVILAGLSSARGKATVARSLTFSNHLRGALFDGNAPNSEVASFSFNEGTGGTLRSEWGNNTLTLNTAGVPNNGAGMWSTESPSGSGWSLSLNGADKRGTFSTPISPGQNVTISVWVKTTIEGQQPIFSNRTGLNPGLIYFGTSWDNSDEIPGVLFVYIEGGGAIWSGKSLSDGKWHHIVWSNDSGNSRVYIDGSLELSSVSQIRPAGSSSGSYLGFDTSNGDWFNGSIDDFRIYNRQLSISEVQDIYAQGLKKLLASE